MGGQAVGTAAAMMVQKRLYPGRARPVSYSGTAADAAERRLLFARL